MKMPSEMEGAVLGLIAQEGPCTAYAVRARFLASPSPQWSGSAGAIYPLVARLERRGLLSSRAQRTTRRRARLHSLTPAGRRLLRAWLAPPLPAWVAGVPPDPLRTRLGFFAFLSPGERRTFVREAYQRVEVQIRAVRQDLEEARQAGDPWRRLVARGALASLRARRAWLREAARAVGGGRGSRSPAEREARRSSRRRR